MVTQWQKWAHCKFINDQPVGPYVTVSGSTPEVVSVQTILFHLWRPFPPPGRLMVMPVDREILTKTKRGLSEVIWLMKEFLWSYAKCDFVWAFFIDLSVVFACALLSFFSYPAWLPAWGICSWFQRSSAAEAKSWTTWRVGLMAYISLQNTCSLRRVTDVWGLPQYLVTDIGKTHLCGSASIEVGILHAGVGLRLCTVDSEDIFNLLLNDL